MGQGGKLGASQGSLREAAPVPAHGAIMSLLSPKPSVRGQHVCPQPPCRTRTQSCDPPSDSKSVASEEGGGLREPSFSSADGAVAQGSWCLDGSLIPPLGSPSLTSLVRPQRSFPYTQLCAWLIHYHRVASQSHPYTPSRGHTLLISALPAQGSCGEDTWG